jgi:hypothetical protein
MNCKCKLISELDGEAANQYAREHLEKVAVNSVDWTIGYRCSETGIQFVMTFPDGGAHGGGAPTLSRVNAAR